MAIIKLGLSQAIISHRHATHRFFPYSDAHEKFISSGGAYKACNIGSRDEISHYEHIELDIISYHGDRVCVCLRISILCVVNVATLHTILCYREIHLVPILASTFRLISRAQGFNYCDQLEKPAADLSHEKLITLQFRFLVLMSQSFVWLTTDKSHQTARHKKRRLETEKEVAA